MVGTDFEPAYLTLVRSGELEKRVETAYEQMRECNLCGRACGTDRYAKSGSCRTGLRAVVSSAGPHHGEEDPLRGSRGSGTIFFSWCNLHCQYCQNYTISQMGHGEEMEPEEIASMTMALQSHGCHNINFVSPSHIVAQILSAVLIAAKAGLRLPLVYNTGGYDSPVALELLDGVIDIYMPDMKYADKEIAYQYSQVKDYPAVNQAAVKEMHRQVGDLALDEQGVAQRGLLIRHLVLPEGLAGTAEIARFLATEISSDTYINVMAQYRPCHRARDLPSLDRPTTPQEHSEAIEISRREGLRRFDHRSPRPVQILWR